MTCTLYAFVIGSIMSLLIRKASLSIKYELDPTSKPPSKLSQMKGKISDWVQRVRSRRSGATQVSSASPEGDTKDTGDPSATPVTLS